jgi:hypothetical protein
MQLAMARLIMGFFARGNFKALKFLGKQLRMPGEQMLKVAKHTVNKNVPSAPKTIAQKIEALSNNPDAANNFLGNVGRQMSENVKKYSK